MDRATIKVFISQCQFLVFQTVLVALFFFLSIKCCVILVVMCGEKTEQSLWASCLLNLCSRFLWIFKVESFLGTRSCCDSDSCACRYINVISGFLYAKVYELCTFLGLGDFKVLHGKDRCRNGKRMWKQVAYFLVFQCSYLFFNAGFGVWLCHWWKWGMYAFNSSSGIQTDYKHKGSGMEWNRTWPWVTPDRKTQVCNVDA